MGTAKIPLNCILVVFLSSSVVFGDVCPDHFTRFKCNEDCSDYTSIITNEYRDCMESQRVNCCKNSKSFLWWVAIISACVIGATVFILMFRSIRNYLKTRGTPNTATIAVNNENVAPTAPYEYTNHASAQPPLRSVSIVVPLVPVNPIKEDDDHPPSYDEVVWAR